MAENPRRRSAGADSSNNSSPYAHPNSPIRPLNGLNGGGDFLADNEAFFTPAPEKHHHRSRSPNDIRQRREPVNQPVIEPDQAAILEVERWFSSLTTRRRRLAAFWSGTLFSIVYFLFLVTLQFSLVAPLTSISVIWSSLLSPNIYILSVVGGIAFGSVVFMVHNILATVHQSARVNFWKAESWLAVLMVLTTNLTFFSIAISQYFDHFEETRIYHTSTYYMIFVLAAIGATLKTIFYHDYRLRFSDSLPKFSFSLETLVGFQTLDTVAKTATDGVVISSICFTLGLLLGPFMFGLSTFWLAVNIHAVFVLNMVCVSQVLLGRLANRFCRQIIMEPIAFDFPPPYNVAQPAPEQQRHILAALNTTMNPLLKLFSLYDVKNLGRLDMKVRRSSVFALSQPAGSPRNWLTVCKVCLDLLGGLREKVDHACCELRGEEYTGEDDSKTQEDLERELLMMPEKARKRIGSISQIKRIRDNQKAKRAPPPPSTFEMLMKLLQFTSPSSLLTSYETELSSYAIDGISQLAAYSLSEDRYGVVQKELNAIMRALVQLYGSIDKYMREKGYHVTTESATDDSNLGLITRITAEAVARITRKFGEHMGFFGLTPSERGIFETIIHRSN